MPGTQKMRGRGRGRARSRGRGRGSRGRGKKAVKVITVICSVNDFIRSVSFTILTGPISFPVRPVLLNLSYNNELSKKSSCVSKLHHIPLKKGMFFGGGC